jgi:VanZ family protein
MSPRCWLPPVLWMGLIVWLSTDTFSARHTSAAFAPLLHRLWPGATPAEIRWINFVIRKTAHVVVYAVLAALWYRAFRQGARLPAMQAALAALAIAVAAGTVDEVHQAFVPSRTSSVRDVGFDSIGGALALAGAALAERLGRLVGLARRATPG